jgi:hypothetical protein
VGIIKKLTMVYSSRNTGRRRHLITHCEDDTRQTIRLGYRNRDKKSRLSRSNIEDACREAIAALWPGGIPPGLKAKDRNNQIARWLKLNNRNVPSARTCGPKSNEAARLKPATSATSGDINEPSPVVARTQFRVVRIIATHCWGFARVEHVRANL